MKKTIAVLLMLACVIGIATMPVAAAENTYYEVGYAKVDINPYDFSTDEPNDLVAIPMGGNGSPEKRLSKPEKLDDNGDGVIDENDGLFATCVAITDSEGATLLIISMDILYASPQIVNPVRQRIVANHPEIDADRIMVNASHTHSGPDFANSWKGGYDFSEDYIAYVERVISQVTLAADKALDDRAPATMHKGSIAANTANCATGPIGDTLNDIRKANVEADLADDVTELTQAEHPELFEQRKYNGVRHYLVEVKPAERTITKNKNSTGTLTLSNGNSVGMYAYYTYTYRDPYKASTTEEGTVYVGGDNFNSVKAVGESTTRGIFYVDGDGNKVDEAYYENNAGTDAFWAADIGVYNSVEHVSETDDTVQVLEFRFENNPEKLPVVLVNFRAHTTLNRTVSLDYRATDELAALGDFTSYYQMSGDWVQALRSALEYHGYRAAYLQGAAGNINPGSRITEESAWMNWAPLAETNPTKTTGENVNSDGYKVSDTTHAKNKGNIYGSELAEVVIECLKSDAMVQINKDGGEIRSVQTKFQTTRQKVSAFEYIASLDYKASYSASNPAGNKIYDDQFYWEDASGKLLINTSNGKSTVDADGYDSSGNKVGATKYESSERVIITSIHHANSAINRYALNDQRSAALELNAIMIGEEYAMVTAPVELFDRYSRIADQYTMVNPNSVAAGEEDAYNLWTLLDDYTEGSYGEPFILGFSNDAKSYLPSKATYEFSSDNNDYATGSYETLISAYEAGNGEAVVEKFDVMLEFLQDQAQTPPATKDGYCSCCGKNVAFTQLQADSGNLEVSNIRSGHYYLESDLTLANKQTLIGSTVCLDLNGQTLTVSNGFTVTAGSTLNLIGEGTVAGTDAPENGGVFSINEGGTLNLYNATVKYTGEATREGPVRNGGILYVEGVFNMYGGKVEGTTINWTGGAAYVSATGRMNLYGGEITEASAGRDAEAADCINNRGTVLLSGNANVDQIYFMPNAGENGPAIGQSLIVKDNYTGTATLKFNTELTPTEGYQVGLSENAKLVNANLQVAGYEAYEIADHDGTLVLTMNSDACSHCDTVVVWEPLGDDQSSETTLAKGHYYISADTAQASKTIPAGDSVCLDLRGYTYNCDGRAFDLGTGATLNILGTGTLSGSGCTGTSEYGGVIRILADTTVNLYAADLRFSESEGKSARNGGILYVNGVFNMYGGSIADGTCTWAGGNVYIYSSGRMNMYGGSITGGTTGNIGNCVVNKGVITLNGNAAIDNIYQMPGTLGDMLEVSGVYTGSVELSFSKAVEDGADVGNLVNGADLSGANITTTVAGYSVVPSGTNLMMKSVKAASVLAEDDTYEEYTTLQDAVNAFGETDKAVVLQESVTEDVATDNAITLDLNGCTITGNITGNGAVTVKDSKTDDYDVEDGAGYGVITGTAANVVAAKGYVKVVENGETSVHKIRLEIMRMYLRSNRAGLYFESAFEGDQVVARNVESFGVALSVTGVPDESTFANDKHFTAFGQEDFGKDVENTSTLLTGVLKTTNGYNTNQHNAQIQVYGRAYIKIDGAYTFGTPQNRSMKKQLEGIDEQLWETLDQGEKDGILAMYETYKMVMRGWKLPNLKAELNG